jgi:hypothetical protein
MWCQGSGFRSSLRCSLLCLAVCLTEATEAQELDAPAHGAAVEKQTVDSGILDTQERSRAFLQVELALQRVQRRVDGDATLKRLANATIWDRRTKYGRLGIGAPTDDQIEIPTKSVPVKVPGDISVAVEYCRESERMQGRVLSGLFNGIVMWKTNNPHLFVSLGWLTRDAGAPDRLLAIVRDELEREGIRLIPMHKLDWPAATTSERLSQLLPPVVAPLALPQPVAAGGAPAMPQSAEKVFASPQEVVAAYGQARAKKDWQACARCLTPASQGAVVREVLFIAGMSRSTDLIKTIEKHVNLKLLDDKDPTEFAESKEVQEFLKSSERPPGDDDESQDAWLYEIFRKRVGDVPAFLADCCRHSPTYFFGDGEKLDCDRIRIEGDKAAGYLIVRRPAPDPKEVGEHGSEYFLPRYFPFRFRRIRGSWLIALTFGHEQ